MLSFALSMASRLMCTNILLRVHIVAKSTAATRPTRRRRTSPTTTRRTTSTTSRPTSTVREATRQASTTKTGDHRFSKFSNLNNKIKQNYN